MDERRPHIVTVTLRVPTLAENPESATKAVIEALGQAGFYGVTSPSSVSAQLEPMAPDVWKEGMLVEYVASADWAWSRGTRGRIIKLDKDHIGRPGHEYQVFWVSPIHDGELDRSYRWWTTPSDVRYIPEV